MNATDTHRDSTAEIAKHNSHRRGNLTAVETPSDSPRANRSPSKRLSRILTAVTVVVAVLAAGVDYFVSVAPFESTDDAFIDAHVTTVAPQVAGRVEGVLVKDNQMVNVGDVLLEINPRDYEVKLAQARAGLTAAQSQLAQAKAQFAVDQAKAEQEHASLVAFEAQGAYAASNLKRLEAIGISGVSQDQIDNAQTVLRSTTANTDVAHDRIRAADAQAALSQASVGTAEANVEQAEASVQQAELNLSYTEITAPETGYITHRTVEQGAYVQPGQALLAIVPRYVWVVANFKETQLTHMRPGDPVTVQVEAYPQIKFTGHVDSIQHGSGASFSLFPPENATGNYVKVVQRVPVKMVLDEVSDPSVVLGPGMSVEPKVRVN